MGNLRGARVSSWFFSGLKKKRMVFVTFRLNKYTHVPVDKYTNKPVSFNVVGYVTENIVRQNYQDVFKHYYFIPSQSPSLLLLGFKYNRSNIISSHQSEKQWTSKQSQSQVLSIP